MLMISGTLIHFLNVNYYMAYSVIPIFLRRTLSVKSHFAAKLLCYQILESVKQQNLIDA